MQSDVLAYFLVFMALTVYTKKMCYVGCQISSQTTHKKQYIKQFQVLRALFLNIQYFSLYWSCKIGYLNSYCYVLLFDSIFEIHILLLVTYN